MPVPGHQVPFAARLRTEAGLPTIAAGLIAEPDQAEAVLAEGHADAVALAAPSSTTRAGPGAPAPQAPP